MPKNPILSDYFIQTTNFPPILVVIFEPHVGGFIFSYFGYFKIRSKHLSASVFGTLWPNTAIFRIYWHQLAQAALRCNA